MSPNKSKSILALSLFIASVSAAFAESAEVSRTVTDSFFDLLQIQEDFLIPFTVGFVVLLVAALIMRSGSAKRNAIGNDTVNEAKILIKAGDHETAREILIDHIDQNPGDDRAKAWLKKCDV